MSRKQTKRVCACCGVIHGLEYARGHLIAVDADLCDNCKNKPLCLLKCSGEACAGRATSKKGLLACDACIAADLAAPPSMKNHKTCGTGLRCRIVSYVEGNGSSVWKDLRKFLTNFDGKGEEIIKGAGMVGACNRVLALRQLHLTDPDGYKALRRGDWQKRKHLGWRGRKGHVSADGVRVSGRDLDAARNKRADVLTTERLLVVNTRGPAHGTSAELAAKAVDDAWADEPHLDRSTKETELVRTQNWLVEGSEYLGRLVERLVIDQGGTTLQRGYIRGWRPAFSRFGESPDPAVPSWRAVLRSATGEITMDDLDEHELKASLVPDALPAAVADRLADNQRSQLIENVVAGRAGSRYARSIAVTPRQALAVADVLQSNPSVLEARAKRKSTPDTRARRWTRDSTPVGKRCNGEDTVKNHIEFRAKDKRKKTRKVAEMRKAERAVTGETWRGARARREAERREAAMAGRAEFRARQEQWKSCGLCKRTFYTKANGCTNCQRRLELMSPQPPPPNGDEL
mgnify:CR=1 FL=1